VKRIGNAKVAAVFRAYPSGVAVKLRALRRLIFAVASKSKEVGELEETLKWRYEGNRAILFDEHDEVPVHELSHCIALAPTYHLPKGRKA
jgi:hypothetical protein